MNKIHRYAVVVPICMVLYSACCLRGVVTASRGQGAEAARTPYVDANEMGRAYGWNRLRDVLSPDGQEPDWRSWSTKCYVAPDVASQAAHNKLINLSPSCAVLLDSPRPDGLMDAGVTPQNSNASPLASVLFNSKAALSILNGGWSLPHSGPDPLIQKIGQAPSVGTFSQGSIIVKAIWEVVNQSGGKWPLRVFDPAHINWAGSTQGTPNAELVDVEGQNGSGGWNSQIYIDTSDKTCPFTQQSLSKDIELGDTVPLSCFVAAKVNDATVGIGSLKVVGHSVSPTYYLVLVGLHVARKESSGWTWTTFWWTNRPSSDSAHFDGQNLLLPMLPVQYGHFAMNSTVAQIGPVYNPYLEGPEGPGGAISNCAHCHSLAAVRLNVPSGKVIDTDPDLGLPSGHPPADYLSNSITTDSIWSVATARNTMSDPGFMELIGQHMLNLPPKANF